MSTISLGMLITWVLPEKIQGIAIFYTYYNGGQKVHDLLTEYGVNIPLRIVIFLALAATFYLQTLWLPYFHQQCIVEAMLVHIPRVITAYSFYAKHDSAIDMELTNVWLLFRNTLIEFSFTWLVLSNIGTTWRLLKLVFWTGIPAILTLAVWSLASSVVRPKWRVMKTIRMSVAIPIGYVLDWIDYLEEVLLSSLPRTVRYVYSDWTASKRRGAPKYEYSSIRDDEIRLLIFQPVRHWWTGIPEANMIIVKASTMKDQSYDAISYRWTDPVRTETILIDGRRFDITRSAFESLLSRCQGNKERKIWIDAICIDQNNQQEKAMQVKMMTDIYFKAKTVIACPTDVWRPRLLAWTIAYEMDPPSITDEIYGVDWHRSDEGKFIPPRWRALALFARNSYFERAWIVQEVAAGCRVQIYLGGIFIDWAKFYAYTSHLTETAEASIWFAAALSPDGRGINGSKDFQSLSGEHPHGNIEKLASLRGDFDLRIPDVIPITFERALLDTRAFKSSDPRDLVYALMGVCRNDARARSIIPDYSKSMEDVILDLARIVYFDSARPSLDLLALAGIGRQRRRDTLPSWVPNLEDKSLGALFTSTAYAKRPYKAGLGEVGISAGTLTNSMILNCCKVDAIASITGPFIIDGGKYSTTLDVHSVRLKPQFIESAVKLAGLQHLGSDDVSIHVARTILGDRDQELRQHGYASVDLLRYLLVTWYALLQPGVRSDAGRMEMAAKLDEIGNWHEAFKKGLMAKTNALMISACHGRCFGVTAKGRFCLVPQLARVGDDVIIPHGAQVPFVIRRSPITAHQDKSSVATELFELVGECYVDGIMDGEAFQAENAHHQTIVLI